MSDQDPASSPTGRSNSGTPAPRAFKPRAGVQRRTKAEREKFVKEEAEREAKRVKEAAKSAGPGTASTRSGRGARGRGGAAQNDTRLRSAGEGGGVFGAGTGEKPTTRARGGLGAGSDELIEGSEAAKALEAAKTKADAKAKPKKHAVVVDPKEQGPADAVVPLKVVETVIEVDEEPDEPRRDIERIWISSDEDEEEDTSSKGKDKASLRSARAAGGLRPVRAPRTVREDEDATRTKAKIPARTPRRSGTEPIDVDEMDVDEPEFIREVPSSPELKKKNLKKPSGKTKDVKFATETPEERTERLRLVEDTGTLRSIFTPDSQTKTHTDDPALPGGDGKLFLLQLPPLTPLLVDPNAPKEQEDAVVVEVKQESVSTAADKDKAPTMKRDTDGPGRRPPPTKPKDPHDHNGVFAACCPPDRLPSGLIGKLNVHASGKITLDWGGADMEVRLGTEVDFLQDAVLVQTKREDSKSGSARGTPAVGTDGDDGDGKAFALGQVQGKMVVIPDWSKLYD